MILTFEKPWDVHTYGKILGWNTTNSEFHTTNSEFRMESDLARYFNIYIYVIYDICFDHPGCALDIGFHCG
jgi:hypothetical protein